MRNALTLVLIVAAAIAMPLAADNGAWFGTPVPPALSDPRKPRSTSRSSRSRSTR